MCPVSTTHTRKPPGPSLVPYCVDAEQSRPCYVCPIRWVDNEDGFWRADTEENDAGMANNSTGESTVQSDRNRSAVFMS